MNVKFCPNCGNKIDATVQRCPHCGYMFIDQPQQPVNKSSSNQPSKKPRAFIIIISILIIIVLALGGYYIYRYNNTSSPTHSNTYSASNSENTQNDNSNKSSEHYNNVDWNSDKASSFDNQFSNWASKMHQSYTSGSTSFDGVDYPSDFNSKNFIINGSNATISMAGSSKNTEYKVVEIRYDADDGYLYLFAFHNGTPIVLFTESGNADDNSVSFKTTANGELRTLFSNFSEN